MRIHHLRTALLLLPLFALYPAMGAAAEPTPGAAESGEKPPVPDADQIRAWVRDLDSDRFGSRETATARLVKAGLPAVEPVADAALSGNLEVVIRGIHILTELSLSNDLKTEAAAHAALTRIAEAKGTMASRRAAKTLARLGEIRQERAKDQIQQLGAKVHMPDTQIGRQVTANLMTVEIGDDYKGGQKGLELLKWLVDVRQITLIGEKVTDEHLGHVAAMKGLMVVNIKKTKISDAGLVHLKQLPNLQLLRILYSPVGDGGVEHLKGLKKVLEMKVYGTKMTPEGAERLKKALEGVTIDFRRGAFLGVGCRPDPRGCLIYHVQPNSAASEAGLMAEDVITTFAGKAVADFDALTELIGQHSPGDKTSIEILRGGQKIKKQVHFGHWQ